MRIWHYQLISALPNKQLAVQWRELIAIKDLIDKYNSPNQPLVNKMMNSHVSHFKTYTTMIYNEMRSRGFNPANFKYEEILDWDVNWLYNEDDKSNGILQNISIDKVQLFPDWHNRRYFLQCLSNLQEKFDCGLISHVEWARIVIEHDKYINVGGGKL